MKKINELIFLNTILFSLTSYCGCDFSNLNTSIDNNSATNDQQELSIMSFNMKYENQNSPSDPIHTFTIRKYGIDETLKKYDIDIIGSQELRGWQHDEIMNLLGSNYSSVGLPRNDSDSERCSIIYNNQKIQYIDGETIWLSLTPNVKGSKSWDSSHPRILTYGKFLHINTNTEFYFFNTHLDHKSSEARKNQLQMVVNYMEKYSNYPILLTGDFNMYQNDECFLPLTNLKTKYDTTFTPFLEKLGSEMKTTHGFNGGTEGAPIDYIFYSTNNITIKNTTIIHDLYNDRYYLSDHYPIHSIIKFN